MIRSMTGYGRAREIIDGRDILVEIKSVNHRFFEFSARVPRAYGYLEEKLKTYLQPMISRGKVDVNVAVYTIEGQDAIIELNRAAAKGYVSALRSARDELCLDDDLTLSSLVRLPDIFTVQKAEEDEKVIWQSVQTVAEAAARRFVEMREREGERLRHDVEEKLASIAGKVAVVEETSPQTVAAYRERLYQKLSEVLEDRQIDEQRILTEAAVFADRVAVDEETVRLKSHLKQLSELLESGEPIGRKLDFLVQECNRETNTIGSKAQDLRIAQIVVDMKSDIEKIREQIQNIE